MLGVAAGILIGSSLGGSTRTLTQPWSENATKLKEVVEHIKDDWVDGAKKSLIEASKQVKKPLIVVFKPGTSAIVFEWTRQLQSACQEAGLPVYKSLETAIKAASKHIEYNEFKSSIHWND